MTESTEYSSKAYCAGRYLIDLPPRTSLSGSAQLHGTDFLAEPMTREDHLRYLDERSAALRATGKQFLYADGEAGSKDTRYFISRGDPHEPGDATRVIEAYKWHRGYRITLRTAARDDADSMSEGSFQHDIAEKTRLVFALIKLVRARADDDIPDQPGTCFPGGFLPGKAVGPERIETRFVLEDKPDVSFSLTTDSGIREPDTLLQRVSDIESRLKDTSGGRTLRRGPVQLPDGVMAEEWLTTGLMPLGVQGHIFELECNSVIAGTGTPFLSLDLHNGGIPANVDWNRPPARASLTEGETLAMWDAASRTLRLRPNGS